MSANEGSTQNTHGEDHILYENTVYILPSLPYSLFYCLHHAVSLRSNRAYRNREHLSAVKIKGTSTQPLPIHPPTGAEL